MSNVFRLLFQNLFNAAFGPEIDKRVHAIFNREIGTRIRQSRLHDALVFGDETRLSIDPTAIVNNALFNTVSGNILIGKYVFFGHNVCILTGTHDIASFGEQRQKAIPPDGRDVIIKDGAWVASNASVLGPCVIGEHAVVAAGAVVNTDVPPFAIVAGVPAEVVAKISPSIGKHGAADRGFCSDS